jgi:hypothetical protein
MKPCDPTGDPIVFTCRFQLILFPMLFDQSLLTEL